MKDLTPLKFETIVIQVTTKCPCHCPQCYMQKGNKDLPIESAIRIVDEAIKNGVQAVQITGGEPLVYEKLSKLVENISQRGCLSMLATSGYGFSVEKCRELKSAGLSAICVSINGFSEAISQKSRDALSLAVNAIETAISQGLLCFANIVVSDDNIDELEELSKYLREKGIEGCLLLRPVVSYDRKYIPSVSEKTILTIDKLVEKYAGFLTVERCYKEYWSHQKGSFTCADIGQTTYFVTADEKIAPCSKMMHYQYDMLCEMFDRKDDWKGGCL